MVFFIENRRTPRWNDPHHNHSYLICESKQYSYPGFLSTECDALHPPSTQQIEKPSSGNNGISRCSMSNSTRREACSLFLFTLLLIDNGSCLCSIRGGGTIFFFFSNNACHFYYCSCTPIMAVLRSQFWWYGGRQL